MKTILANVSTSLFIRNFLRTDALESIKKSDDVRMVFLVPVEKLAYYRMQFAHERVIFDVLPETSYKLIERIFKFLESQSIHTHTVAMLQRTRLWRHKTAGSFPRRMIRFLLSAVCRELGHFWWWRVLIRMSYHLIPNHAFDVILGRYQPDMVFCPNMIYSEDYVLLKAAHRRNIPTVGMLLSWDNFYSKTFLRVPPKRLIVHTEMIKGHAMRYGDYPADRIAISGIPQYDRHFREEGIVPREQFIRGLGGDPSKKLILYAFSGKNGLHLDMDMLDIFHGMIANKEIIEEVNVLVRPYPKFDMPASTIENLRTRYGFLAKRAMAHVGKKGEYDWEFDDDSLYLLTNSLAHADLVITMYSTFFIEAAIFDKPLIAIGFDGSKKLSYWNSSRRFFEWNHLADIKRLGGIRIVQSRREFLDTINEYLTYPEHDREGRKRIVAQQCQFTDGKSAERVASILLGQLKNRN